MRCPLIFAIPNGEYPAGASGSPTARSTRANGILTSDKRALLDLKTESGFKGLAPRSNTGAAKVELIKNAAAIDVTRVVLKASMALPFVGDPEIRNQDRRR